MEGIKNSVLSNSILFPLNSKIIKNQSNINLDYMNEIAKLPYDTNDDENYYNIQKNKFSINNTDLLSNISASGANSKLDYNLVGKLSAFGDEKYIALSNGSNPNYY